MKSRFSRIILSVAFFLGAPRAAQSGPINALPPDQPNRYISGDAASQRQARAKNDEGYQLYLAGRLAEAETVFQEASRLDCGYLVGRWNWAATLSKMGFAPGHEEEVLYKKAVQILEQADALDGKKTLIKIDQDPDYDGLRESSIFQDSKVGQDYLDYQRKRDPVTRVAYRQARLGWELQVPSHWNATEKAPCGWKSAKGLIACVTFSSPQDADEQPLELRIGCYDKRVYHRDIPQIDGYDQPVKIKTHVTKLAGWPALQMNYDLPGVEDSVRYFRQLEVIGPEDVWIFIFSFSLNSPPICDQEGGSSNLNSCQEFKNNEWEIKEILGSAKKTNSLAPPGQ